MKKTKYVVRYSTETARFSNYADALIFARMAGNSEVSDRTGLIAQFRDGELTKEFGGTK